MRPGSCRILPSVRLPRVFVISARHDHHEPRAELQYIKTSKSSRITAPDIKTLKLQLTSLLQISDAYPEITAIKSRNIVTGEWTSWTYQKLQTDVTTVSKALIETGLHRHHCVVIIGNFNCPHWVISHLAAISAG